jgi:hypothetical protein
MPLFLFAEVVLSFGKVVSTWCITPGMYCIAFYAGFSAVSVAKGVFDSRPN